MKKLFGLYRKLPSLLMVRYPNLKVFPSVFASIPYSQLLKGFLHAEAKNIKTKNVRGTNIDYTYVNYTWVKYEQSDCYSYIPN